MFRIIRLASVVISLTAPATALAQPSAEEEELELIYGDEEFVSIATGRYQPIARAPSVATVITADDIKAIGATDLDQVLETVPGLHVSNAPGGLNPIYIIRGIHSEFNPQVLMLINGIPLTHLFVGNRGQIWGGMPVNNISRIEVIRGPGSALYGADAFAGVINIITKTSSEIDGPEVGGRFGSYNTREAWLLHDDRANGFDIAFSLQLFETDGSEEFITADSQTFVDRLFGTNASLAPGPVSAERKGIDTQLDIARDSWRLRVGYQGRYDIGTGAGIAQALDPVGHNDSGRFNLDLTHTNPQLNENWDITTQLSYLNISEKSDLVLFPPNHSNSSGTFPEGVIGNPDNYERHIRLGIWGFYTGFKDHRILLGTGFNYGDMYRVRESKNFSNGPDGLPIPLGSVIDVSHEPTLIFIQPHDRRIYYAFAQDEWAFARDWNLTAGVRYDDYSDFGGTVNPRLALVWQNRFNMTSKLLYGRAFRPPSFAELYNINNPVALGNPDLEPETIDTVELSFDLRGTNGVRNNLSLFRYRMQDIIRFEADPAPATTSSARNTGEQTGYGLEWETSYEITKELLLTGNYSFQRSTDRENDSDAGYAPHHQVYGRAEWNFSPGTLFSAQLNWVADRERSDGDNRPPVDDYVTVNLTLRHRAVPSPWEFALLAHNIFDEEAFEPSPAPGLIPNDLPLPGRAFFFEMRYHL